MKSLFGQKKAIPAAEESLRYSMNPSAGNAALTQLYPPRIPPSDIVSKSPVTSSGTSSKPSSTANYQSETSTLPPVRFRKVSDAMFGEKKQQWNAALDRNSVQDNIDQIKLLNQSPFLIRECNALQLVQKYQKEMSIGSGPTAATTVMTALRQTALKMIEQLAQTKVVEKSHFADVVPLAMLPLKEVSKQLLEVLTSKVRAAQLIDMDLFTAIAQVVQAQATHPTTETQLGVNDVLSCLEVCAESLVKGLKVQEQSLVEKGLDSLNHLLDAAVLLVREDGSGKLITETVLEPIQHSLNRFKPETPADKVALAYAQQALLRVMHQKAEWEKRLMASYNIVKGVMQMSFAVVESSPTAFIDAMISIYGEAKDINNTLKEQKFPWFNHIYMMKLLLKGPENLDSFFLFLDELKKSDASWRKAQKQSTPLFKGKASASSLKVKFPEELLIALVPVLDDIIRDRKDDRQTAYPMRGVVTVREAALLLLGKFYTDQASYGASSAVRALILPKLYRYCTFPELPLQQIAKQVAKSVYQSSSGESTTSSSFVSSNTKDASRGNVGAEKAEPGHYWFSETMITEQNVNPNFEYKDDLLGRPTSSRVSHAFESVDSIAYLIEGMHLSAFKYARDTLRDDLETYVPVKTTLTQQQSSREKKGGRSSSGSSSEIGVKDSIDLWDGVCNFLKKEDSNVLLIHGNAGSGKSLLGRYLELVLWNIHQENSSVVPIFIPLPSIKHPTQDVIREPLLQAGFTSAQIQTLRQNQDISFVFILDGFDEISVKTNLYRSNEFSQWPCQVIITSRTEYLQELGDYKSFFTPGTVTKREKFPSSSSGASDGRQQNDDDIMEYYIRPFDESQQVSFFKKWIKKEGTRSQWSSVESYQKAIQDIPGLNSLITTPFMLRIVSAVLGDLHQQDREDQLQDIDTDLDTENGSQPNAKITRAKIYQVFMSKSFAKAKDRLFDAIAQSSNSHGGGYGAMQLPHDFDAMSSFLKFSMDLAASMFVNSVNSLTVPGGDYHLPYTEPTKDWHRFFSEDAKVWCSRQGAPLVQFGRQRAFQHKSMLEYFAALMLVEELRVLLNNEPLDNMQSGSSEDDEVLFNSSESASLLHYFNQRSVHEEPGLHGFLLDMFNTEPQLEKALWEVIFISKTSKQPSRFAIATGNALTLLVSLQRQGIENGRSETQVNFDLSGIFSKGAKLDNGNFMKANFSNSVFINTSWDGACVDEADFTGVSFHNNLIEECAALSGPTGKTKGHIVLTRYNQVIGVTVSGLYVWSLVNGGQLINEACRSDVVIASMAMNRYGVSPNGRWVVIRDDNAMLVWDAEAIQWVKQIDVKSTMVSLSDDFIMWTDESQTKLFSFALSEAITSTELKEEESKVYQEVVFSPLYSQASNGDATTATTTAATTAAFDTISSVSYCPFRARWNIVWQTESNKTQHISVARYEGGSSFKSVSSEWTIQSNTKNQALNDVKIWSLQKTNSHQFLVLNEGNKLECLDTVSLKSKVVTGPGLVSSCCVSKTGRYILTKHGTKVSLWKNLQLFQNYITEIDSPEKELNDKVEDILKLQFLYSIDGVTSELVESCFTFDERLIVLGESNVVTIRKVEENSRLQTLFLPAEQGVEIVTFASHDHLLVIQANNKLGLLRYRVELNEQLEMQFAEKSETDKENETANAVLNQSRSFSALGAKFLSVKTWSNEDSALFAERGGIFESESSLIKGYFEARRLNKSIVQLDQRHDLSHYIEKALRCQFVKFCSEMRWNPNSPKACYAIVLAQAQMRDGYFDEFIIKLDQIGKKLPPNKADDQGATAVQLLARKGHAQSVSTMLKMGTDPNLKNSAGFIPLYLAAQNGHKEVCRVLIDQGGADVNATVKINATPLIISSINGHLEVVKVLLEKGANIDMQTTNLSTALFFACKKGLYAIASLLMEYKANVNLADKQGETPLGVAAYYGFTSVCKQLLSIENIEINTMNSEGNSPLFHASENGHDEVCALLLKKGANVNEKNSKNNAGNAPLHMAASKNHVKVCEVITQHEACEVDILNQFGESPLCLAAERGHVSLCRLLLLRGANAALAMSPSNPNSKEGGKELDATESNENVGNATTTQSQLSILERAKVAGYSQVVALLESHLNQYPQGVRPKDSTSTAVASSDSSEQVDRDEQGVIDETGGSAADEPKSSCLSSWSVDVIGSPDQLRNSTHQVEEGATQSSADELPLSSISKDATNTAYDQSKDGEQSSLKVTNRDNEDSYSDVDEYDSDFEEVEERHAIDQTHVSSTNINNGAHEADINNSSASSSASSSFSSSPNLSSDAMLAQMMQLMSGMNDHLTTKLCQMDEKLSTLSQEVVYVKSAVGKK